MGELVLNPQKRAPFPKAVPFAAAAAIGAAALAGIGSRLSHEGQVPAASNSSSGPDNGHPGVVLPTTTMPSEQALAEIATVEPLSEPTALFSDSEYPFTFSYPEAWQRESTASGGFVFLRPVYGGVDTVIGISKDRTTELADPKQTLEGHTDANGLLEAYKERYELGPGVTEMIEVNGNNVLYVGRVSEDQRKYEVSAGFVVGEKIYWIGGYCLNEPSIIAEESQRMRNLIGTLKISDNPKAA